MIDDGLNDENGEFQSAEDFLDAMRTRELCITTVAHIFNGKRDEAMALHPSAKLFIETMCEALEEGSTPEQADARFRSSTEDVRRELAGIINSMIGMLTQVRMVLAKVGYEEGDKHVERGDDEEDCGDPNCPVHGKNADPAKMLDLDGLKNSMAKMLGIDPDKIEVEAVSANTADEAIEKFKKGETIKSSDDSLPPDVRVDAHTLEVQRAIEKLLQGGKPKKRKPQFPS